MRQVFTCEIKNTDKETVEAAMREMYNCATEMGFSYHDDHIIHRTMIDGKATHTLNATFFVQEIKALVTDVADFN